MEYIKAGFFDEETTVPSTSTASSLEMAFSQSYSDFNSPTVPALTPPSAHSSLGSSFASPPTPFGDLDAILPFTDGAFRGYSDQASAFAAEALTMDPSHLFQPALAIGTPAFPSPPFAVPAALPVSPQAPAPQGRRKRTLTQVESEEALEVEAKAPKPKKVKKAAPKKAKMIVESDGQGEADPARRTKQNAVTQAKRESRARIQVFVAMFPDEKNTSDTRRPVIVKLEGQNDQLEEEIAELEHQLRKLEEAQEDV